MNKKIVQLIAAARPNFMKIAPLYHALSKENWCELTLVHTGQHYDQNMSATFLSELNLPEPDYNLGVGSGTHAEQTAGVMIAHEKVCLAHRPDIVVVAGDVNSTIACALVAAKLGIPIAHLEAGLRSGDRGMPEEINRILTDAISDILWTPSPDADENLRSEGIPEAKISCVGNIMIDSFELLREQVADQNVAEHFDIISSEYCVATIHRPVNVDHLPALKLMVEKLRDVAQKLPAVFPVHPRTKSNLIQNDLWDDFAAVDGLKLLDPLSYIEFMGLITGAKFVITDSGGIQEETSYLSIPCLTVRDSTERPITITHGTNKLTSWDNLVQDVDRVVAGNWPQPNLPSNWDGRTAGRIADNLKEFFGA